VTVHLVKLCVGIDSVLQLETFQRQRREQSRQAGAEALNRHFTRNTPRRATEVLDGGSLYWVIRRQIRVRQKILRLDELTDENGRRLCGLILDPQLIQTEPRSFRPFQGWRYMTVDDAPVDLDDLTDEPDDMPAEMRRELRSIGLI